jgi:hypothetical protein
MASPARGTADPAWHALVVRPRYRERLASGADTYETLVAREYTDADRASDASWTRALRVAQQAFVPTATVAPAGYDLRAYVGYRVGPPIPTPAGPVLDYKVFFEFDDFRASLSPERYAGFVARLDEVGFHGDSKIDLRPGRVRFQYNDLIVHAPSIRMAACAEATGRAYFEDEIAHVGRGVDVRVGGRPTDWHHFLLSGRYDDLPIEARDFVEYRVPVGSASRCPAGVTHDR